MIFLRLVCLVPVLCVGYRPGYRGPVKNIFALFDEYLSYSGWREKGELAESEKDGNLGSTT
jgi:hypothetical protein